VCGATLEGVLATIKKYKSLGIWIELTTLIIPGYNDGDDELRKLAAFIAGDVGPETPWHVSAFHPTYRLTEAPQTPGETLVRAREIGLEAGLRYVYTGNIPDIPGEDTYCHVCKKPVIKRRGFSVREYKISDGACLFCGARVDGVGL
jgi:pyruvate formate lyase activating enzyme